MQLAPLHVPLERRLQTAAVVYFIFLFIIAPAFFVVFPFYVFCYTKYWILSVLYLVWYIYDYPASQNGAHPWQWYRSKRLWNYFADYFPAELVKTAELSPDVNYIIGCHPHGILGISTFITLCTEATGWSKTFPGIVPHLVTLNSQFFIPFRREMALFLGAISCNASSIENVISKKKGGQAVGILLGGAEEALDCHPDVYDLKLSSRKGFVKLALKHGAHLVPMYSFGETNTYRQIRNHRGSKLREFQCKFKQLFGFSPPLFMGRGIFNYSFGLLPFRTPLTTVVGEPIPVPKIEDPSQEQIEEHHEKYCRSLKRLFDAHKCKYGLGEDASLNIY